MAALASLLKRSPKGYLLVDSGDFLTGTPEVDLTGGDAAVECMNAIGVQACAVGNHDFDQGRDNLARLAKLAKFPLLSANLSETATASPPAFVQPFVIRDAGGIKVAVIGLVTSKMEQLTFPENIRGLSFEREEDALRRAVREARLQGAKVVIVAAHVGLEPPGAEDREGEKFLADRVAGIQLILGGHSHSGLEEPYHDPRSGTLIVHNRSELRTVTRTTLRVWKKTGRIFSWSYKLIPLSPGRQGEDPEMKARVEAYRARIAPEMDAPIGNTVMTLDRSGPETLLGNWQTDILRWWTKADLAFQNIGGIRADLPEGLITPRRIYAMSPFQNTVVTMELTGAQVRSLLEHSVAGAPGLLQVSGLRVVYDRSKPAGSRAVEITVSGQPLDDRRTYRAATNNFLAEGGDGFRAFLEGSRVIDRGVLLRELYAQFVRRYSPVSAKLDGRISFR
jgi:2',3'-cyclic-nucleotide 2'-phosphodiesterase (5'-nucleotidase family)